MGHLTEADPVAVLLPWLQTSEEVTTAFGGPDRVGPYNRPPYPCAVLTDPPGNDRDLRHLIVPLVQIEVLGDPDGTPGKHVLRRCLYAILERIKALPDTVQDDPEKPVVTHVQSTGGGGYLPLPTGQPRYLSTVQVFMHPPRVTPNLTP